jgi:hypothetical protein
MLYNILPKAERSDRGNSTCPRTKLRRDVGSQVCATDIEHDGVVGRLLAAEARSWSARKTAGWSTLVLRRRRRAEIRRRALWEFDPKVSAGVLRHQKYSREVWSRLHRRLDDCIGKAAAVVTDKLFELDSNEAMLAASEPVVQPIRRTPGVSTTPAKCRTTSQRTRTCSGASTARTATSASRGSCAAQCRQSGARRRSSCELHCCCTDASRRQPNPCCKTQHRHASPDRRNFEDPTSTSDNKYYRWQTVCKGLCACGTRRRRACRAETPSWVTPCGRPSLSATC